MLVFSCGGTYSCGTCTFNSEKEAYGFISRKKFEGFKTRVDQVPEWGTFIVFFDKKKEEIG